MAAMKPRTGDGPLEVTKEGRGIVMRVPLEGGGRLVVEMSAEEASALGDALKNVVGEEQYAVTGNTVPRPDLRPRSARHDRAAGAGVATHPTPGGPVSLI